MPLVGGGGAGNVAGGNPAGIGSGINYVRTDEGNFAYAFSGDVVDAGTGAANATLLNFTTGNETIMADIGFTETEKSSEAVFFKIIINSSTVVNVAYDASPTYTNVPYVVLIPPYSHVEVKWGCSATETATGWISGRVY